MIGKLLEELAEYGRHYASACADRGKLAARKVGIYVALAVMATLVATALVVTAVVMVCLGLADAIRSALDRPWLGELIVGFSILLVMGLGTWIAIRQFLRRLPTKDGKQI